MSAPAKVRLASLDAFRGFVIIAMLWVNNLGHEDARIHQFAHAKWGEFPTFTDMIFPWFLFMMGCALPYARASRLARGIGFGPLLWGSLVRGLTLYVLGCCVDSSVYKTLRITTPAFALLSIVFLVGLALDNGWSAGRLPKVLVRRFVSGLTVGLVAYLYWTGAIKPGMGVLQLLGVAYFIAALIYEAPAVWRHCLCAGFLVAYWAVFKFLPVPGYGTGVFEEAHNPIQYLNQSLRPYRMAGILSAFPCASLVLIGTLAGEVMRGGGDARTRIRALVLGGAALVAAGLFWHLNLPMSKEVWTPPYIVFAGGIGAWMLALFYWVVDVRWHGRHVGLLVAFGLNPITAYFVSIMLREHTVKTISYVRAEGSSVSLWTAFIQWITSASVLGTVAGGCVFTILYISLIGWGMRIMQRRGWVWRV